MYEQYLDKLESKFSSYFNNAVGKKEIIEFVDQVDMFSVSNDETLNILKKSLFEILTHLDYLDGNRISYELKILLNKMKTIENGKSAIIRYGKPDDSSYRLIDYIKCTTFVNSIHNALKDGYDTLLFIDDGVNSGHQIISIFQEFMGMNTYKRKTRENHVKELSSGEKEKLKVVRIIIGFIYFNSPVERFILSELQKLGLFNVQIVYNHEFQPKLTNRHGLFDNQTQADTFIHFLEKIGLLIQQSNKSISSTKYKERWTKKRIRRSALGYNNAQQLVVYEYNIPTYTITILWQHGYYSGKAWKGLFERND